MTTKKHIARRNGRPAHENAPPRRRGDMAEWRKRFDAVPEPRQGFLAKLFGRG